MTYASLEADVKLIKHAARFSSPNGPWRLFNCYRCAFSEKHLACKRHENVVKMLFEELVSSLPYERGINLLSITDIHVYVICTYMPLYFFLKLFGKFDLYFSEKLYIHKAI